ncbi:hypothetical protein [Nocardia sp. NPDC050406]|uniref:hypothetical protein n=1 Tax=Nocardia sp. NPDC050406 TaxID=3364318 RepID=UPI0037A03430
MSPTPVLEPASVLLDRVESLPYPQRMRALAHHARHHRDHPGFAAFLTEMADLGHYGRRIAVHQAMAARDLTYLTRVLAGPEPELRRAALRAVRTLPIPDEAVPPALVEASTALRIAVYRTIVHARRTALADSLLVEVYERWGAREAAVLLPGCSSPVVARWLPSLAHAVTTWKMLGRRHPRHVMSCLDAEFATSRRYVTWRAAFRGVVAHEPARALDLLERHDLGYWSDTVLTGAVLGTLFRTDPRRTARLLAQRRRYSYRRRASWLAYCGEFSDAQLLSMVSAQGAAAVLRALPIERRGRLYRHWDFHELQVLDLLPLLPRELAASEARRLREWHSSVWHSARSHLDDPRITLRITAFLPFDEAEPELREAAFTGDPRRRDVARVLLLGAAQRHGDSGRTLAVLGDVVDRMRNERDPARAALLEGLATLRLDPRWVDQLDRLVDDAIQARDTSDSTREAVRALADRALNTEPALADWGLRVHVRLIDRFGAVALGRPTPAPRRYRRRIGGTSARPATLGRVLRRGQEHDLLALLRRPRDHELTVALARSLGSRLPRLPELREDLRRAVLEGSEETARVAVELMLRRIPDKEDQVVALVADEPGTLRFAPVWRTVATRRTDLLPDDPREVLADNDIEPGMAGRWTARQRATIGATLKTIADDRAAPVDERVRALRGLGRIPFHTAPVVEHALAGEPVIAEAAIEALAAQPRALARLLLRIPGPVALATASTLCRVAPPWRLREVLAKALLEGRVGARKLAARQLVSQRVPEAVDLLLRAWADPDLHPDVRIAVATALRRVPENARARAALAEIPHRYASEAMIRTLLQATPGEYAPEHRAAVADLVRDLLAAAEGPGVRFRAAKAFAVWVPWLRGGTGDIIEAAVSGDDSDLTVFATLVKNGLIRAEALTVLRRLLDRGSHERAREVARTLECTSGHEPWRQDLARSAAELLLDHPAHLLAAARMLIALLPTERTDAERWAAQLDALADRFTPLLAMRFVPSLTSYLHWRKPIELIRSALETLGARGDLIGDILALGLLEAIESTPERHAETERLRSSPNPEVRQLAWDIAL